MDLLLWRHAEAVDGLPDSTRELTERGIKQAHKVAEWLEKRRPKKLRVLVSPTTRTRQTASAFTQNFEIVPALAPGNDISSILGACGWPDAGGSVLVVGHQPELGRLAAGQVGGGRRYGGQGGRLLLDGGHQRGVAGQGLHGAGQQHAAQQQHAAGR